MGIVSSNGLWYKMRTKMKKICSYLLLPFALSVLVMGGCSVRSLDIWEGDPNVIEFCFDTGSPVVLTKAEKYGVTNYNENLISLVDCFFYPPDKTGEDAVFSALGRTVESVEVNESAGIYRYKVSLRVTASDKQRIFRSETDGTCKVFIIANASLNYDSGGTSIADLKQKLLERDFSAQIKQGNFVMCSQDDPDSSEGYTITMSGGIVSGQVIPMDRSAAKAQLFIKVPQSINGANAGEVWLPDVSRMKVYLVNGLKRGRVKATYTPATDGSDYFNFEPRPLYDISTSTDADDAALYSEINASGYGSYIYSSYPFYSYPVSWRDIHDHATQYIVDIPWYIHDEDPAEEANNKANAASRFYQISANTVASLFERNHYYRTYMEIRSLGGVDVTQAVTIPECSYLITPWFQAGLSASGYPVEGNFDSNSYLVVEPEKVILSNEETAVFTYLSSSVLDAAETKVIEVRYYNYKNSTAAIVRDTDTAIANDPNTNSSAIQVDISEAGKVKVTHKLYNNDGSQKIYVEYQIKVHLQNTDGLYEDITIVQYPPLYVLSKPGDNAFIDGYFRHVRAPFDNAFAYTAGFVGYYRSVAYMQHSQSNGFDGYWYLGTRHNTNDAYTAEARNAYMVATPYGNLTGKPGDTTLSLFDLTGVHLSAFDASYHGYSVQVGRDGGGATSQSFDYRIGDPRVPNDFTGTPKLVDYLTGMGNNYSSYNNYRRYNSDNVYRQAWGTLADEILIGQTDHEENTLIAPYILFSSSWAGQVSSTNNGAGGVTYEEAKRRCATYQEGGYPAGRWRLPTEAEIMFTVERQRNNDINTLFNDATTSVYWSASGYYYSGGVLYENTNSSRRGAARCVYDAWYWGDEPVEAAAYTYTPMP